MFYDYQCEKCGEEKEESHGMTESPKIICENCGAEMKKLISGGTGIIYKGNGWAGKAGGGDSSNAVRTTSRIKMQEVQ